ncbi:guanylate-binding protein 1-like [Protopterus annectens]|uniref:guanylate-binding protein 1-like n=1 Tax=Protopterus annectens TaxID=7888 RepID=UPI001CFBE024|nr:guanylate-binding protein 1-like [Protopterus annectens]
MNAPQCLIEVSKDGKMTIRPETLQIVKKINKRLVIVGIAGIYRTGKSYLMNRLAGRGSGFLVTPGVQSSTRGIWMWCLPHPHKSDCVLMLLDTEGLQAIKQKAQVSSKIFSLVVLLSSTLIYNNMGVINQHLLSDLQFITELTKIIQVKTKTIEEKCKNYASFFPDLIWALRDFTNVLELEGQKCTADQYLEYVLNSFSDSDDEDTEHGSIAKTFIMESFPNQNCFVFEQPATPKLIANCSKLENTSLNLTFLEQSETFCQHIYNKSKVKCICGEEVRNGEVLARFIHLYVNYINSGDIPLYKHAVQTLSTTVNTEMIEKALNNYKQKMRAQSKIPTETKQELEEVHKKNMDETVAIFRKGCFGDNGDAENKLKHAVNEWYQEHCKDNEELSRRLCESLLIRLFKDIEQKYRSKFYAEQDEYQGHQLYLKDRNVAVQDYNETMGLGVMKQNSLDSQMEKENDREECILKEADQDVLDHTFLNELHQQEVAIMAIFGPLDSDYSELSKFTEML